MSSLSENDDARYSGNGPPPIDMSYEAIWRRLRKVDELNELCRYLSEFEPAQDSDETAWPESY